MKTLFSTVAMAALLCLAGTAQAQDDDAEVTRMAKEHYKQGLEAYKAGHYDVAIKELKKAYLLKRLPALLLNIGATYRKTGEYDLALHFYQKYLDEAPPDAKDRAEVQKTIGEIQQEKATGRPAGNTETAPPPQQNNTEAQQPLQHEEAPRARPVEKSVPMPTEWSHQVIDAAPPEQPIDVRVSMPVMKGVKVYVFYRVAGQEKFTQVLMKRRGAEKVGRIPADVVSGKALQYYVEAKDAGGATVKSSGSESNPNIVMIDPSAPPQVVASVDSSQAPERAVEETGHTERTGLDDEAPMSGQHEQHPRERERPRRSSSSSSSGSSGKFGPTFIAGAIIGAVGIGMLAGGAYGLFLAGQDASTVSSASKGPIDGNGNPIYFNNDPNAGGAAQFSAVASEGQSASQWGTALTVLGSLFTVTGITCIIVDQVALKKPAERPRRTSDEARNWFVAPAAGPHYTGLGAGFSF